MTTKDLPRSNIGYCGENHVYREPSLSDIPHAYAQDKKLVNLSPCLFTPFTQQMTAVTEDVRATTHQSAVQTGRHITANASCIKSNATEKMTS